MENEFLKGLLNVIDGKMTIVASDETLDRQGESIKISGWELDNFKANPVIQWAHDYSIPPIGRANAIRIEQGRLVFEPELHTDTQLASEIKALVDKGFIRAVSVGFIPKEMNKNVITKAELLEISFVPVPANPNALVFARSAGMKNFLGEWEKFNTEMKSIETEKSDNNIEQKQSDTKVETQEQIIMDQTQKILKKALQKIARQTNFALNKLNGKRKK